jgi:hypothetical protein
VLLQGMVGHQRAFAALLADAVAIPRQL